MNPLETIIDHSFFFIHLTIPHNLTTAYKEIPQPWDLSIPATDLLRNKKSLSQDCKQAATLILYKSLHLYCLSTKTEHRAKTLLIHINKNIK
jgi:hypothetical protein